MLWLVQKFNLENQKIGYIGIFIAATAHDALLQAGLSEDALNAQKYADDSWRQNDEIYGYAAAPVGTLLEISE